MRTNRILRSMALLAALSGAIVWVSCSSRKAATPAASLTPAFLDTPIASRPPASAATIARGRQLYQENCVQCHGREGRGDGYGAPFLVPSPRDFTSAEYRIRTTESGQLPTDEDLFRTISRGANGTGMPPWMYLLSDDDRWALVDYVKTFQPRFESAAERAVYPLPDPPGAARSVANGKAVFAKMQCSKCHGEDGRGVGPSSNTMVDSKGRRVNARDFTQPGTFRAGWTEREVIRTLETGMNGVPMPSYTGILSPQDEYDLAAYVLSLAEHGPGDQKRQSARSMEGVGEPQRVVKLREHAWKYEPSEIRIKRGEVVKVEFSATDNGLGAGHGFAIDGIDQQVFINGARVGAPLSVTFRIDNSGRYNFYCATQCSTTELHPHMRGVLIVE